MKYRSKRNKTIIAYMVMLFLMKDCLVNKEDLTVFGFYGSYQNVFNYQAVGCIIMSGYLFILLTRLRYTVEIPFITRIPAKKTIVILQTVEMIFSAIKLIIFYDVIFCFSLFYTRGEIYLSINEINYLLINFVSQLLGWSIIGFLFIVIFDSTEKNILSILIVEILGVMMFFSKNYSFSLRNFIYDIRGSMFLNIMERSREKNLSYILINLILCIVLYFVNIILYEKKFMYGRCGVNENN